MKEIGKGGMGVVFEAVDRNGGRRVALKVLKPEYQSDPIRLGRFLREARIAAKLSHPNICGFYEAGQAEDGTPFIAMELVEGQTLASLVKGRPLGTAKIVALGLQVAAAL